MFQIELERFREAQKVLQGNALYTPLVELRNSLTPNGQSIYLKAESLQPAGAFKIRGATYCLSKLTTQEKKAGVIAFSTGNHAQAVAMAARRIGIHATIVMSPDAPEFKVAATLALGGEVVMAESALLRKSMAEDLAKAHGYYLVPPYDHPNILIGQGTIGMEILEQSLPSAVFVPVGGGGLIAGIAMAIKQQAPSVKIIGVEPELENDAYESMKQGKRVSLSKNSDSISDAIKILSLGDLTYPIICNYVDEIVTVTEEATAQAMLICLSEGHLLVEPSGALSLAAGLSYSGYLENKPIICVASGGNTTLPIFSKIMQQFNIKL